MKTLNDLLAKYKNIIPTDSLKKEAIIKIIDEKTGIKLDKKDITFNHHNAYLKTSSKIKGEVYINKRSVLIGLKEMLGKNCPEDII
ncbi:MAG: hypothetical protein AAB645_02095 [Patescibacteria group bacterium]